MPAKTSPGKWTLRWTLEKPTSAAQTNNNDAQTGKKQLITDAVKKAPAVCPDGKLNSSGGSIFLTTGKISNGLLR